MSHDDCFDLVVAGGGPAGLTHAFWHLRSNPQHRVAVLEASARAGGWVETKQIDGYQLELGPQGFRPDGDAAAPLLDALQLGADVVPCSDAATRRFVVRRGRLEPLPAGPGDLLRTRLLSWPQKLRVLLEARVKSRSPDGESVAAFVARHFGRGAVPLAEAMMHGIYAGDAHSLEVASTLPVAVEIEAEHRSLLRGLGVRRRQRSAPPAPTVCTFAGGMQQSTAALLRALGDCVSTDAPVRAIEPLAAEAATTPGDGARFLVHSDDRSLRARSVCLACPPAAAAALLQPHDAELGALLAGIRSASVASVHVGFAQAAVPANATGFGFLVPRGELDPVLGALFCSSVFPQQAPPERALFRVMSGGTEHPGEVDRDDGALLDQAVRVLRDQLAVRGEPAFAHVSRARNAIPQYAPGHLRRLAALRERLARFDGLALRGAGYRKVAVVGQWARGGSAP